MTALAKNAFGAELWLVATGGVLAKVAELTSIEPPVPSRDTQDVTTHDSTGGAAEFIAEGVYDPGEIKAKGNYIANTAGDIALRAALMTAAMQDFKIVAKGSATTEDLTGACVVTSYGPDSLEVKGVQTFSITLKVSGATALA